ncbi:MAG: hypothetical protein AAGI66_03175, partial [Cyanobacteria bacterium P01_H01_bin.74]
MPSEFSTLRFAGCVPSRPADSGVVQQQQKPGTPKQEPQSPTGKLYAGVVKTVNKLPGRKKGFFTDRIKNAETQILAYNNAPIGETKAKLKQELNKTLEKIKNDLNAFIADTAPNESAPDGGHTPKHSP